MLIIEESVIMKKVPKSVQKVFIHGVTKRIEDVFSKKNIITEEQINRAYGEILEAIKWGQNNSIYNNLKVS